MNDDDPWFCPSSSKRHSRDPAGSLRSPSDYFDCTYERRVTSSINPPDRRKSISDYRSQEQASSPKHPESLTAESWSFLSRRLTGNLSRVLNGCYIRRCRSLRSRSNAVVLVEDWFSVMYTEVYKIAKDTPKQTEGDHTDTHHPETCSILKMCLKS